MNQPLPNARYDALLGETLRRKKRKAREAALEAESIELARQESVKLSGGKDPVMQARVFQSEIAALESISEYAAGFLIDTAYRLVHYLPRTMAALKDGAITYSHAQVMVRETATLSEQDAGELEAAVLARLAAKDQEVTPPQLKKIVRKVREFRHPESIPARHEAARQLRGVSVEFGDDGMGTLTATLPNAHVAAIHDRLTKAGLSCCDEGDKRSLSNKRADTFVRVMLGTPVPGETLSDGTPGEDDSDEFVRSYRGITPTVMVTVPVLSLLGHSIQPGTLDGTIPIDVQTARILTARAPSAIRLLTHPETGVVLSVGRKRYKIPKDLRLWLMIRDQTCRYPGCGKPARNSQVDHTHEWHENGETEHTNLAHLCQFHHTMKSLGLMQAQQAADGSGVLTWTFPSGRTYVTHPAVDLGGYGPAATAGGNAQSEREPKSESQSENFFGGDGTTELDEMLDFDLLPEDPMSPEEFKIIFNQTVERARLSGQNTPK